MLVKRWLLLLLLELLLVRLRLCRPLLLRGRLRGKAERLSAVRGGAGHSAGLDGEVRVEAALWSSSWRCTRVRVHGAAQLG